MVASGSTGGEMDVEFTPESGVSERFGTGAPIGGAPVDTGAAEARGAKEVVKAEAGKIGTQAADRARALAGDGKERATGALDDLARAIEDAAGTLDDKVGGQFGGYARQASGAVTQFADTLRDKDVDELIEEARAFVQRSPGVAIGAAAAAGFVLARVLWAGFDANRDA